MPHHTSLRFAHGLLLALVWWGGISAHAKLLAADKDEAELRFAFSSRAFEGVNTNDAKAALKVWSQAIVGNWGVSVSPNFSILSGVPAIMEALVAHEVEAVTVASDEYWAIRQQFPIGSLFIGTSGNSIDEEYIVLVNRDSGIQSLAELRGGELNVWRSLRTALADIWLTVELHEQALGGMDDFWQKVSNKSKLSQTVLPVFFGQTKACLVTRSGFALMCELNPQLARSLIPIAVSSPIVPSICFFRGDFESPKLPHVVNMLGKISSSAAGRQTLTLFQQNDLTLVSRADLDVTCDLVARYDALTKLLDDAAAQH